MKKILITLAVILYFIATYTFLLHCSYLWFLKPVFEQLPIINFMQAMALLMFVRMLQFIASDKNQYVNAIESASKKIDWEDTIVKAVIPWGIFIVALIIHFILPL